MATKNTKKENSENLPVLTPELANQYRNLQRKEFISRIKQVVEGFGVAFIVMLYFVMAEFLFEISWFGLIFKSTRTEHNAFWAMVSNKGMIVENGKDIYYQFAENAKIFDDWFGFGNWIPKLCMTLFLIGLTVMVAYLIAFTINSIVGIIKNLIISSRKTIEDIGKTATSGIVDGLGAELPTPKRKHKTKKLLEEDPELDTLVENYEAPKEKPIKEKRKKTKEEKVNDEVDEMLNSLLTNPDIEEAVKDVTGPRSDE